MTKLKWYKITTKDIACALLVGIAVLLFRSCFFDWNYIPSGSMEPNLYKGDHVWIDKSEFGGTLFYFDTKLWKAGSPERGDIITFKNDGKIFIKRVIGMPGDIIKIDNENTTINGKSVPTSIILKNEKYIQIREKLGNKVYLTQYSVDKTLLKQTKTYNIPKGRYFVMGDHRNNSKDSRIIGLISEDQVLAKTDSLFYSLSDKRNLLDSFFLSIK